MTEQPKRPVARVTQRSIMGVPLPPARPRAASEENLATGPHTLPPAAPRATPARVQPEPAPKTQVGLGPRVALPSTPDDWDEDTAIRAADTLSRELAQRNAELAEARRALEAAKRQVVEPATGPTEKQLRKAAMHSAVLKVLASLAGALVAVTTYLTVHTSATVPAKLDDADAKQKAIENAAETDHDALLALRAYVRAQTARRDCIEAQMASALVRYTGHRVTGVPTDVEWLEQQLPTRRPVLLWDRAIWYPTSPCAAEPKPP